MGESIDERIRRELAAAAAAAPPAPAAPPDPTPPAPAPAALAAAFATDAATHEDRRTEADSGPSSRSKSEIVPQRPLVRGATIGHFIVLDKVGAGGMAIVLAAYDPKLDRKVAIKILRGGVSRESALVRRQRLLREAQAMAKLQHENVVTVHEAGELDDGMFIAMELVDGETLKQWLTRTPRTWRETLAVLRQAGAGLGAAHAAGLVHRDFKPDNVLVRKDGRVQVTDFGIVSIRDTGESGPEVELEPAPRTPGADPGTPPDAGAETLTGDGARLTSDGARLGTPPYMAAEQHTGRTVDARSDQFAFCATAWESLYGERPFAGTTRRAVVKAITAGTLGAVPAGSAVPRWIHRILVRGLSVSPEDRFPSMAALLDALGHDPAAARRRTAMVAAAIGALALGAVLTVTSLARDEPARCAPAPERLAGVWDAAVRSRVERDFLATGVPYAAFTVDHVASLLETRARGWVAMRAEACRATARGDQSGALLDLRMRCLDRRRDELAALTHLFADGSATPELVATAVDAARALPSLETCADLDALTAAIPPPGDAARRAGVDAAQRRLAEVGALIGAGRYHAARELATAITTQTAALDYLPVQAEALLLRGEAEAHDGDARSAEASLTAAAEAAARGRSDAALAHALAKLVWAVNAQSRYDEALALASAALFAAARTANEDVRADALIERAAAQEGRGDLDGARGSLDDALAIRTRLHPESSAVAQTLNHLGSIHDRLGRTDAARAAFNRALVLATAELGPHHPSVAVTMANLCSLDLRAGKVEAARTCQTRALAILTAALGDRHPTVAWATNDMALILEDAGDRPGAERAFRTALAIWEATSGPDHPDVAWPLINLGVLAIADGRPHEAIPLCERAGRVIEAASGPAHPDLGLPLVCVGEAQLADHRATDAAATLDRGLALFERASADPAQLAEARFALARALIEAGGDRGRALALARAAAAALTDVGPDAEALRSQIAAWLARR